MSQCAGPVIIAAGGHMDRQSSRTRLRELVGLRQSLRDRQGGLEEEGQEEGEKRGGNGCAWQEAPAGSLTAEEPFPRCHDERPFLEDNALGSASAMLAPDNGSLALFSG